MERSGAANAPPRLGLHSTRLRSLLDNLMVRALSIIIVVAACSAPLAADPAEVFAFVQKSCVGCHNTKVKSGNVDLRAVQTAKTFEEDRETWEKVVEKLKTGQMPPPGSPRPPDA